MGFTFATFASCDVVVDFEISTLSAVRSVLPTASLQCCRFHLGQAWGRHMNSLGHGPVYTDKSSDTARSRWLKLCFGLSLLPSNEVQDAFSDDIMLNAPASDVAVKFAGYVLENHIDLNSHPRCGLNRRMCLEQYLIPTMALRLIIVV